MKSSSAACHIKRYMKHSKRLMMVYVKLTNQVQNMKINSKNLDIISQRCSLTPSLVLCDATLVRSIVISFIRHQDIFILQLFPGYLRCGEWMWLVLSSHLHPKDIGFLVITDYFSKWVEAIFLRKVKTSDMIKFIKHHVVYRFGVPRWIIYDNWPQFVSQTFQRFCNKFRI